jgi:hypothetical protein
VHALIEDRLEKHGRRGRSIANLLMHIPQHVADEHRSHVFVTIRYLNDAAHDRPAVIKYLRQPSGHDGINGDNPGTGTQGWPDYADHLMYALLHQAVSEGLEYHIPRSLLCHLGAHLCDDSDEIN